MAAALRLVNREATEHSAEPRDGLAKLGARSARLAPYLIAAAGVAGSLFLAWGLRSAERTAARAAFERDAMELMAGIGRELDVGLEQVRSTAALFESSELVTPHEFRTFTRASFEHHPVLRALLWIESELGAVPRARVRMSEGPEAELVADGSGFADSDSGDRRLAGVLAHTLERGELTLSEPLELGSREPAGRVAAFVPVSVPQSDSGPLSAGFVGGLYDVEKLLEQAKSATGAPGIRLHAVDSERPFTTLAGAPLQSAVSHGAEFQPGGRRWRITSAPPEGFLAARTTWRPWAGLALGLLATALLVTTVVVAAGRARIQRLVEGRTLEIRRAYDTLTHEGKERLWAMAETRQLERQLRAIIDLVPDSIYVKDPLGRFLLANVAAAESYGTTVEKLTAARHVDRNTAPPRASEPQDEEQRVMTEGRSAVLPAQPFVDARGRKRILRKAMIPCDVFGANAAAMLCVATDITEQKQAEDVLRAQNGLLAELALGEDPERVLAEIVVAAEELVPGMRCSILFLAPDGRHLRHGFAPSLPEDYNRAIDGLEIGPTAGSCGAAAALGERVVVADVTTHPNWEPYRALAARANLRACWSQPIRAADGAILGTFAMYYAEPRGPEPYEERFIESMAHMAGIAIERARMKVER